MPLSSSGSITAPRKRVKTPKEEHPSDNEDVVPAAQPSYFERLIVDSEFLKPSLEAPTKNTTTTTTTEDNTSNFIKLFTAPPNLYNATSLQTSLQQAKEGGRWLLVNIQRDDSFDSHRLNRDVWRAESVGEVIKAYFHFWQRSESHPEGTEFCRLYHVTNFPYICVLDPRTGRNVKHWDIKKFVDEYAATSELMDFTEGYSFLVTPGATKMQQQQPESIVLSKSYPLTPTCEEQQNQKILKNTNLQENYNNDNNNDDYDVVFEIDDEQEINYNDDDDDDDDVKVISVIKKPTAYDYMKNVDVTHCEQKTTNQKIFTTNPKSNKIQSNLSSSSSTKDYKSSSNNNIKNDTYKTFTELEMTPTVHSSSPTTTTVPSSISPSSEYTTANALLRKLYLERLARQKRERP